MDEATVETSSPSKAFDWSFLAPVAKEIVPMLLDRFRPVSAVEQLAELRATLELRDLEAAIAQGAYSCVRLEPDQGVGVLPRFTLVTGDQHSGKTTLMAFVAALRGPGRRAVVCVGGGARKKILFPEWCEFTDGLVKENGVDLYIDEGWQWFEDGGGDPGRFLRTLFHSDMRVMMTTQSLKFITPKVLSSGAIALAYTGGVQSLSMEFEREEIRERMLRMSRIAQPKRSVALWSGGVTYEFEYGPLAVGRWGSDDELQAGSSGADDDRGSW